MGANGRNRRGKHVVVGGDPRTDAALRALAGLLLDIALSSARPHDERSGPEPHPPSSPPPARPLRAAAFLEESDGPE